MHPFYQQVFTLFTEGSPEISQAHALTVVKIEKLIEKAEGKELHDEHIVWSFTDIKKFLPSDFSYEQFYLLCKKCHVMHGGKQYANSNAIETNPGTPSKIAFPVSDIPHLLEEMTTYTSQEDAEEILGATIHLMPTEEKSYVKK